MCLILDWCKTSVNAVIRNYKTFSSVLLKMSKLLNGPLLKVI